MIKRIVFLLLLLTAVTAFSMEIVELKDGRKILIKEDFTWEEIAVPMERTAEDVKGVIPSEGSAAPLVEEVTLQEAETKLIMERYPELLEEDLKGGVGVEVVSSEEYRDNIEFLFKVTNNSSASVVRVEADILLLDDEGNVLHTVTDYVYKGFNRMADTYVRVGKSKEGKMKIEKMDNWNGKIRVIIKNVESR
ncbi:ribonuclease [Propionigenium maris DSM 9537]|uniref:Ribonuclease n=1 Tax=Propionigenium maris DSM 9537 TaxID=1123000 RepID=A0A9W6GQB1_9FUSO|nr:DUF3157 family protein [Propionigenium maris]GLI58316.1 ribonuclease [Propionigenium maris DSM 9537]